MRKQILTTIAVLPLLLNLSQAAQRWEVESWQPYGIPSEESGSSSYLGVDIMDITSDRLGALKLKEEKGVEVTMVDQDAPAGKAGIKEHDVILSMNGSAVESKTQLQRMIHETPAGRVVALGLSRDGQPLTIKVQLADRSKEFARMGKDFHFEVAPIPNVPPIPNMPDFEAPNIGVVYLHSMMRSGLMVENLSPQLGEFFGAKNGSGVLVRSVEKGSRAEKAGLRAGDVITRVGDQPVHDTSDFTQAMHSHSSGGSVNVGVIRDKKEQTLTLTLPERKESGEFLEQSLEAPELNAEAETELSKVQDEIAKLQPQLELAREESRRASKELSQSFCDQQKKMKEQAEKLKQQINPQIQREMEKSRQQLERQMERLRRQMRGDWLDI
ncbi:MAG TPA: PDZ domain-containing protein [Candidatus Aquilonibacter sp.]|jgi:serine protease Do|nr:PDZ domain-containing protein [Candidatus Aquilonibacter sp.]